MAYEVILSVGGQKDYDHTIDYFLYELKNPQAAIGLIDDFTEIANHLKRAADSYPILSDNPKLAKLRLRKIHLKKYHYKLFYHIDDNTVYIDAFIHDRRDYESLLS